MSIGAQTAAAVGRALLIAAFNALPRSSDTSDGFFSRWIVIPFTGYFPPGIADPGREEKLHEPAELRGLLVLAVRGLQRLMARRSFYPPPSVRAETAAFRRVADPVRAFLDEYVPELTAEWMPRTQVYRAYDTWSVEGGYKSMGAAGFYERLEAAGNDTTTHRIRASKRMGTRGYVFTSHEETQGHQGADPGAGAREAAPSKSPAQSGPEPPAGAEGAALTHFFKSRAGAGKVSVGPAPSAPTAPACSCGWGAGTIGCRCGGVA